MGNLLSTHHVQRRRSICSSVRHQTLSRRHFGLQIVQTSTQWITKYGMFFRSEFTAGKSKLWTSCDSVSLRNGNAWTSAWLTTQSNSGVDVFALVWLWKAVISNSHCRTAYRKRYAVWPTAFVYIMILEGLVRFLLEYFLLFLLVYLTYWRPCVLATSESDRKQYFIITMNNNSRLR